MGDLYKEGVARAPVTSKPLKIRFSIRENVVIFMFGAVRSIRLYERIYCQCKNESDSMHLFLNSCAPG